jgi:hypothetical protein
MFITQVKVFLIYKIYTSMEIYHVEYMPYGFSEKNWNKQNIYFARQFV